MWSIITGFFASFFRGWLTDKRSENAQRELGAAKAREIGHADIDKRATEAQRRADAVRGDIVDPRLPDDPHRRD